MSDLFTLHCGDALDWLKSLPDDAARLLITSPPYEAQRSYGLGFKLRGQAWVDWMRPIVVEACRVTRGLVVVNAAGPVKGGSYSPSMEWLVSDLTRLDGVVCGPAPYVWWKVCGTPGSGATTQQRRDWEPLYTFCRPDVLPLKWADNTAFGHPPKFEAGGDFTTRAADGVRANAKKVSGWKANGQTFRNPDGTMRLKVFAPPAVSNPGNVIRAVAVDEGGSVVEARVGGGHQGHDLAHDSEAPMALAVAERFVRWFCPPNECVLDCFAGSGTTGHAAILHGRRFLGNDLRQSQVDLSRRRLEQVSGDGPGSLFAGQTDLQRDFLENLP